MITDPFALQEITNKCLCFHCGKRIDPDGMMYDIVLKQHINSMASSEEIMRYKNAFAGWGSILRFHIECFKEIAGDEYLFDQNIWK